MSESNTHTRFVSLLVATTIAAYVLIALGTAVSTTGSAETCTTWPSCSSEWAVGPITSEGLLFWGHRGAALVTAALLAGAAVAATRLDLGRITRAGLVLACVLFPVQIVVGAVLVVRESMVVGAVHLVLAMGIFVGLLAALTRTLEARIERGTSNTEHASEVAPGPTVRP
ncbi:MAG: protoheme IX farnesyltransferase, partial [Natronococcus sp.]